MKKAPVVAIVVLLLAGMALPQREAQVRSISGLVTDKSEAPLRDAVVYLQNTKTLAVKTFITDAGGQYRFHGLAPNTDYEVYAEYKGQKSGTKTLSAFDTRANVTINLKIDTGK